MQKSIFFLFLIVLAFGACQNEGGTAKQGALSAEVAVNGGETSAKELTGEKEVMSKGPFINGASPEMEKVMRTFTTNFWVNTAYYQPGDQPANQANQGNWYQFNQDGTFLFGHFDKELAKGKWTFDTKGKNGMVHIQAENTAYSGMWNVKIGKDEDLMIWVGTEQYKTNGVQQRLENLLFIPKDRKELGMD